MKSESTDQTSAGPAERCELTAEEEARQESLSEAAIAAAAREDLDNPPLSEKELDRAAFGRRLRRLRAGLNLSQSEFARRYGIPLANIRQYEIGRTLPPPAVQSYLRVIEAEPERVAAIHE